jgi:hypothetical protein
MCFVLFNFKNYIYAVRCVFGFNFFFFQNLKNIAALFGDVGGGGVGGGKDRLPCVRI